MLKDVTVFTNFKDRERVTVQNQHSKQQYMQNPWVTVQTGAQPDTHTEGDYTEPTVYVQDHGLENELVQILVIRGVPQTTFGQDSKWKEKEQVQIVFETWVCLDNLWTYIRQ